MPKRKPKALPIKKPARKKRKVKKMEEKKQEPIICPISLEVIPPEYVFTLKLNKKKFQYDVRELLQHVERTRNVVDPMTRIKYTKRQLERLREAALNVGIKPLTSKTLNRMWYIDELFTMIMNQVRYHTYDDLYHQINQFMENTMEVLRHQDDYADSEQGREVWASIKYEANKLEREICIEWNRRNNEELDRKEEEEKVGEMEEKKEAKEEVPSLENAILSAIQNQSRSQLMSFMMTTLSQSSPNQEVILLSRNGFPIFTSPLPSSSPLPQPPRSPREETEETEDLD